MTHCLQRRLLDLAGKLLHYGMRVPVPANTRLDNLHALSHFANKWENSEDDERFFILQRIIKDRKREQIEYMRSLDMLISAL